MARPKLRTWREIAGTARGQNAYARFLEEVTSGPKTAGRGPEKKQAGGRSQRPPAPSDSLRTES